jgi:hypothetical protein
LQSESRYTSRKVNEIKLHIDAIAVPLRDPKREDIEYITIGETKREGT